MKSAIVKRSVVIAGQKTSVSLEDSFWAALKEVARKQEMPLCELITGIDAQRTAGNLSSAIRLFVLNHFRDLALRINAARAAAAQPAASAGVAVP
jgi:predicted DNA-binding ribbon-helix-helix protein